MKNDNLIAPLNQELAQLQRQFSIINNAAVCSAAGIAVAEFKRRVARVKKEILQPLNDEVKGIRADFKPLELELDGFIAILKAQQAELESEARIAAEAAAAEQQAAILAAREQREAQLEGVDIESVSMENLLRLKKADDNDRARLANIRREAEEAARIKGFASREITRIRFDTPAAALSACEQLLRWPDTQAAKALVESLEKIALSVYNQGTLLKGGRVSAEKVQILKG